MPKAYQAYYSDYVVGAGGLPIVGATVSCYPTSAFAAGTLPTGTTSGGVTATSTVTTDSTGLFAFTALPADDYHILVTYTPLGGALVGIWRYHVPIVAADLVKRAHATSRASAIPRTLSRLLAGQNVTLLVFGDDVAVGYNAAGTTTGGWVALLAAQLALLYPNASINRQDPHSFAATVDGPIPSWDVTGVQSGTSGQVITLVNAGVKSDTVLRVIRRMANLTTSWPAADVVVCQLGLYESSSGLSQQSTDAVSFGSNLESLVNIVRSFTQAEVLLLTPHANPPIGSSIEAYADQVRAVAGRNRCGLADIRALWADKYVSAGANDGYDPWLLSGTSRTLPTDAGHAAIAAEVAKHLTPGQSIPFAAGLYSAGKVWELVRVPYNSTQVALVGGGWALHGGWQGSVFNSAGTGYEYVSATAGNTITIAGRFVDLSMLCRRFSDCGQVSVVVDGGSPVTVDLYRAYPASTSDLGDANGGSAPQDRVLLAHGLSDSAHTVVVTILASKNAGSSGFNVRFESFELGRWRKPGYEVEANEPQQRVQRGSVAVSLSASPTGTLAVSFVVPFTGQTTSPTVVACSQDSNYYCTVNTITNTGYNLVAVRRDGTNVTASPTCSWIAVG